ncbi:MAG: phospho-N-acetylmuramoyl-pentapeptide-transferase [Planctomycetota bacterium]|nr:MAG: phospho-N-acetylmuramoyl-pentapeptide-transferase [Planctomycetota bacterium]
MIYHLFHYLTEGKHYAYENSLFRATVAGLFCFLVVLLSGPAVIRVLLRFKIGDRPQFDRADLNELMKSKANVPTMGGILIIGAMIAAALLFADLTNFYVVMGLVTLLWLGVLGGVDDALKLRAARRGERRRDGLRTAEKLLFQLGLGVVLGTFIFRYGGENHAISAVSGAMPSYRILDVPFYKPGIALGVVSFMLITVLVMTASSNAVNLTDGLDGLAAGCAALCTVVFLALTFIVGTESAARRLLLPHVPLSLELVVLLGAMLGALLGFLWHNCHQATVFMGDTGSLPLGGLLGYVAVVTRQELMLFIAGGVFVIEALSVILQVSYFKMTGGKRIFACSPLHHHFQMRGWSEPKTVVRFWLIAALCGGAALATIKLR